MADDKKIVIRVSKELHKKVKVCSAQTGQSISDKVRQCLERWVEENDEGNENFQRK